MTPGSQTPHLVDEWQLRQIFNSHFMPEIDAGRAELQLHSERPPKAAWRNQLPHGTVSQTWWIRLKDARGRRTGERAFCHRYWKPAPDGPDLFDPKHIWIPPDEWQLF